MEKVLEVVCEVFCWKFKAEGYPIVDQFMLMAIKSRYFLIIINHIKSKIGKYVQYENQEIRQKRQVLKEAAGLNKKYSHEGIQNVRKEL